MITLTDKATEKIHQFAKKEGVGEGWAFLFGIRAGGCSGFEYVLNVLSESEVKEDERNFQQEEINGIRVVLPKNALTHISGVIIDYNDGLMESGFKISNPNACTSCGCGNSFR
jgi:iron-sulfur cluster assembly protein